MPSNKKKAKKSKNENGLTYNNASSSFSGYLTASDWTSTTDYITYSTTATTAGTYTYGGAYSGTTLTVTPNNNYTWIPLSDITYHTATFVDTTGTISYGPIKIQMLFENELIEITEKGEVLVDGKLELNPTKIGRALLKALEQYRQEDLNDPKDFFNKD